MHYNELSFKQDRGRSVIEGAHIHIFGFTDRERNEYMNMGPLNYRSPAVPGLTLLYFVI